MAKVHIKGRILQLLERADSLWDHEIRDVILREYRLDGGPYWSGTIRMTLTDLYAGGLISHVKSQIDPNTAPGSEKLLNCYRLNAFGRTRMRQTGLSEELQ
ncbi:hypothetical protein [Pseudogemmobacter humi]|uniref:Uncharacterized protein n=1 Tax=Pseudogemmobacter humi TaxID=2483812 RepID=A0A3P5XF00_9RHOB|nr:hypothetical protein [Pseudogemmobacter humi]VDC27094.1 hypothetical protein XINFAN_01771 [Pseudogemmobacter humi]